MVLNLIAYAALALLLAFVLLFAFTADRANHHPYLGLGSEVTKRENGAEWESCADCGERTAVYKHEQEGLPPGSSTGGTICGNCGATIGWNADTNETVVITPGEETDPYDWR